MERSVSGDGCRPSIHSAVFGEAVATAQMLRNPRVLHGAALRELPNLPKPCSGRTAAECADEIERLVYAPRTHARTHAGKMTKKPFIDSCYLSPFNA